MLVLASYDGLANDCVVCSGIRDNTKVLYLHDPNEWIAYGPRDKLKAKKQCANLDKSIADLDDKAFVKWNVPLVCATHTRTAIVLGVEYRRLIQKGKKDEALEKLGEDWALVLQCV